MPTYESWPAGQACRAGVSSCWWGAAAPPSGGGSSSPVPSGTPSDRDQSGSCSYAARPRTCVTDRKSWLVTTIGLLLMNQNMFCTTVWRDHGLELSAWWWYPCEIHLVFMLKLLLLCLNIFVWMVMVSKGMFQGSYLLVKSLKQSRSLLWCL